MATMSPPGDELVITYIIVILTHLRLAGSTVGPSFSSCVQRSSLLPYLVSLEIGTPLQVHSCTDNNSNYTAFKWWAIQDRTELQHLRGMYIGT